MGEAIIAAVAVIVVGFLQWWNSRREHHEDSTSKNFERMQSELIRLSEKVDECRESNDRFYYELESHKALIAELRDGIRALHDQIEELGHEPRWQAPTVSRPGF